MRVLVSGGGGFLGSHLAKRLAARGDRVTVIGRRRYTFLPEEIASIKADLRDRESILKVCKGMDAVFHAGALTGIWGDKKDFYNINVEGTRNIIEGCIRNNIKKLIFTSSPSVIFNHEDLENVDETSPYAENYYCEYPRTKAIAEKMVIEANGNGSLLTVSLRPHLIWGPGDPHLIPRILEKAKKGKLIRVGDGLNRVDINYIDNAVEGHILVADALEPGANVAGNCYFLNDGEPVVLWQWIDELLRRMNIPPVKRSMSFTAAKFLGAVLESLYKIFPISGEPRMTRFVAEQLAASHYFDISRARRDFNYKPIVSIEEGLNRLVKRLQSHPTN